MTSHAGTALASDAGSTSSRRPGDTHADAPVTRRDRFAGRRQCLHDLQHVLLTSGQHALVLGERGIGRTSLLNVLPASLEGPRRAAAVTVRAGDDLGSLWARIASALAVEPAGTTSSAMAATLSRVAAGEPVLVTVDDVHVATPELRRDLAAVVGALVSPPTQATLVFAALGMDVAGAWPEAALLANALDTHLLPRLAADEAQELAEDVHAEAGVDATPEALHTIAERGAGLPGAVRRLAVASADAAHAAGASRVDVAHVEQACATVLAGADEDVKLAYEHATIRARRGIFPEILWACAHTPREVDGSFATLAVRQTLQRMLKREIRGLTNQISVLAEGTRGQVLIRVSGAPNPRYRFADPRLEPYVLLRGLGDRDLPQVPAHADAEESWLREAA